MCFLLICLCSLKIALGSKPKKNSILFSVVLKNCWREHTKESASTAKFRTMHITLGVGGQKFKVCRICRLSNLVAQSVHWSILSTARSFLQPLREFSYVCSELRFRMNFPAALTGVTQEGYRRFLLNMRVNRTVARKKLRLRQCPWLNSLPRYLRCSSVCLILANDLG